MGGGGGGEGLDLPFPILYSEFLSLVCMLVSFAKNIAHFVQTFCYFSLFTALWMSPFPRSYPPLFVQFLTSRCPHTPFQYPNRQCYVLLVSQPSLMMASTMEKKLVYRYSTGATLNFSSIKYT